MKSVLIIMLASIYENTSANRRAIGLINGLLDERFDVYLLSLKKDNDVNEENNIQELLKKIRVIEIGDSKIYASMRNESSKNAFMKYVLCILRNLYHRFCIWDHTYNCAVNADISVLPTYRYDYIISFSDPKTSHIYTTNLMKQGIKYKKWIEYWGDPLMGDVTNKSVYPDWVLKKFEKRLFNKADKIIYTSPVTCKKMQIEYKKFADKMEYVPTPAERIEYKRNSEKIVVGYYGAYYSQVRNIMPLYEAFCMMPESFILNLVGDSDVKLAATRNINLVSGRCNVNDYEIETDIFICLLNKKGTQIPGKIYYYALSGRPVVVILDGENQKIIKEVFARYKGFYFCDNNVSSIVDTINKLHDLENNDRAENMLVNPKEVARMIIH